MVIGSIATSLGAMTSYAGYKRFIKPGPTSALWLGGLAFVGSIAGAAAAATGSLASEVLVRYQVVFIDSDDRVRFNALMVR